MKIPPFQLNCCKTSLFLAPFFVLAFAWIAKSGAYKNIPLLSRLGSSERLNTCMYNLRALELSMHQYQQDYDECFPPTPSKVVTAPYGWADALLPYVKDASKLRCPSDTTPLSTDPTRSGYTSYWFNSNLYGKNRLVFVSASLYYQPILFGEGGDGQDITNARYAKSSLPSWINQQSGPAIRHPHSYDLQLGAAYIWDSGSVLWQSPNEAHKRVGPAFKVR